MIIYPTKSIDNTKGYKSGWSFEVRYMETVTFPFGERLLTFIEEYPSLTKALERFNENMPNAEKTLLYLRQGNRKDLIKRA